jgi:hypothetical protein
MKRYTYTFIQLIAAGLLITIKVTNFAFLFPFILVLLVPFRKWCLPFVFTERELTEVMHLFFFSIKYFIYRSLMERKIMIIRLMMKLTFMVKFIYQYNDAKILCPVVCCYFYFIIYFKADSRTKKKSICSM